MYKINCVICHGDIGNGNGELLVFHVYKELTQEYLWKIAENARYLGS